MINLGGDGGYDQGSPAPYITPVDNNNYDSGAAPKVNYSDPSFPSPAPTANTGWQIPTTTSGAQYGGAPWAPGASAPSAAPTGMAWNDQYASYQPTTAAAAPSGAYDDNAILAQIGQWANMPGADPSLRNDPNYWLGAIKGKGGLNAGNLQYWQDASVGPSAFYNNPNREAGAGGGAAIAPGGSYDASNPFSDPATKGYVDLLNSRIQSLLTPQQNPDMAPLLDYMRKYFQQLQNPVYTDAQRAIIQTQQTDPMERQRQAELKNVALTMANRGITPGSGPYLQAERDINQKYDSLRAQAQGGQAVNEINLGRQNQSQAVDVGSAIASLQNGMFQQQDQRANQAVTSAAQIPNLAQQRLSQAITLLNGNNVNPAQLLSPLAQFQQQGINQNSADSQYWSQIISGLAKAFGL